MVFNYTIQTGPDIYSEQTDETFCDETDFDYEVDDNEIEEEIVNIIYNNYFKKHNFDKKQTKNIKKEIKEFISDYDLFDTLSKDLYDELEDSFRDQAIESYNN